ncbi:hypothetical protein QL285_085918 [Trifolium repens]|nr:hypothetical protein QL285_085918 [Trifolium repens]
MKRQILPHSPPTFISLSTPATHSSPTTKSAMETFSAASVSSLFFPLIWNKKLKVKKNPLKKSQEKKSRVILPHTVTHAAQQMLPKEKLKVKKNHLKKNRGGCRVGEGTPSGRGLCKNSLGRKDSS